MGYDRARLADALLGVYATHLGKISVCIHDMGNGGWFVKVVEESPHVIPERVFGLKDAFMLADEMIAAKGP